jgi:hypothetical protein
MRAGVERDKERIRMKKQAAKEAVDSIEGGGRGGSAGEAR